MEYNETAVELACNPDFGKAGYTLEWKKGDQSLEASSIKGRYSTTGNKVLITKPGKTLCT